VTGVFLQVGRKSTIQKVWGSDSVSYTISDSLAHAFPEMKLSFTCGGFSQVNYHQNRALVQTVLDWSGLSGSERVLDLFCGNGNFSLPIARHCAEVVGYEDFEQSITDAVKNSLSNGVRNARFHCLDATEAVSSMVARGERFDIVILDPPRSGASDVVRLIPLLEPGKIVYVSCDPQTLARDLALLRKNGYDVAASRPFDMFPQTHHIESVTILYRNP
jgi:23S rRNA (uracil1939-C5)-methyltransferase